MKETKFKQTLVQTKEGSRHCEEHSDVAIQGGFKMTEVGMIPSDWEVKTFCELFEVLPNNTLSRAELNKEYGSYKNVHYGDILVEFGEWIDCSNVGLPFINSNAKFNHTVLQDGDIVIADTAEDETVGKSTEITNAKNKKIVSGLHTIPIRPKIKFAPKWLGYYINSACWHDQILPFITGTKVSAISKAAVSQTKLFFPAKIEEQQRIANALSDVDTLIANLEKLIAKKKNIKQGAMQQLLTGKKRLPGFGTDNGHTDWFTPNGVHKKSIKTEKVVRPESIRVKDKEQCAGFRMTELGLIPTDWENVNISKTCTIKARIGWQGLKSTEYLNSGDYILVTGTDFKNGFIDWSTCSYVSEWRFKQDKNIQIKKGDVLVTKDGTIGKVAFLNEIPMEGTLNSGVFVVRSKDLKKIDSVYLSLVFKSSWFDNFLDEITSGSTIVHLYQKDFVKFNFPIPSSIEEQTAIANVLSDMDTEISALETKLAKYRTLKTGMMQQLLTGKIRLV